MSVRPSVRPGADLGFRISTDGRDQVLKSRSLDGRGFRPGRAGGRAGAPTGPGRKKRGSGKRGLGERAARQGGAGGRCPGSLLKLRWCLSVCPSVCLTTVPRFNWRGGTGPDSRIRKIGFGLDSQIRKTGFGKRVPGFGKTGGQTGQGGAGGRAGFVCPSVLQGRAGAN